MISSKDRAKLKNIIANENSIFQIGKEGLTDPLLEGIDESLSKRELIKINVLQNCKIDINNLASTLQEKLNCEIVLKIGRKIAIYRFNKKNKTHVLD